MRIGFAGALSNPLRIEIEMRRAIKATGATEIVTSSQLRRLGQRVARDLGLKFSGSATDDFAECEAVIRFECERFRRFRSEQWPGRWTSRAPVPARKVVIP